eukprot:9302989-Pyramimonas_sp.AAC.1
MNCCLLHGHVRHIFVKTRQIKKDRATHHAVPTRMHHKEVVHVRRPIRRRVAGFAPEEGFVHADLPAANLPLPDPRPHPAPHAQEADGAPPQLGRRLRQEDHDREPQVDHDGGLLPAVQDGHEALQQRLAEEEERPRVEVVPAEPRLQRETLSHVPHLIRGDRREACVDLPLARRLLRLSGRFDPQAEPLV